VLVSTEVNLMLVCAYQIAQRIKAQKAEVFPVSESGKCFNDTAKYQDYVASVMDGLNTIWEHWWNDTCNGNSKHLVKRLFRCIFIHYKTHVD